MTFEEFQANLQQIRKYNAKLSKYKLSWFDNELYKSFKRVTKRESGIILTRSPKKKDNLKKRRKALSRNPLPDSLYEFYFDIASIINARLFDRTAEDWKEDKVFVEVGEDGSEHLVYRGEYPGVLGAGSIHEERDDNLRFKILRDYYLSGYEVEHIARNYNYADNFGVNRTSIYDHRDKGVKELYQLYTERSQKK